MQYDTADEMIRAMARELFDMQFSLDEKENTWKFTIGDCFFEYDRDQSPAGIVEGMGENYEVLVKELGNMFDKLIKEFYNSGKYILN